MKPKFTDPRMVPGNGEAEGFGDLDFDADSDPGKDDEMTAPIPEFEADPMNPFEYQDCY